MIRKILLVVSFIFLLTAACTPTPAAPTITSAAAPSDTPPPTATAVPTDTPAPSDTPLPPTPTATSTRRPTATLAPSSTPGPVSLPDPVGEPVESWNGIPIMPEAVAGQDDGDSYIYIIDQPPAEVADYYTEEMAQTGWSLLGSGAGETGTVLLIFTKGADMLTISILDHEIGAYVLIIGPGY